MAKAKSKRKAKPRPKPKVKTGPKPHIIYSKIQGMNDEPERQNAAVKLWRGQELVWVDESDQSEDEHCIAIYNHLDDHLGHLPKKMAKHFIERKEIGWKYRFFVQQITGGGNKPWGCILQVQMTSRGAKKLKGGSDEDEGKAKKMLMAGVCLCMGGGLILWNLM